MAVIRDSRVYPEYEYREFPKWVKDKDGNSVLVENQDEEDSMVIKTDDEEIDERSEKRRRKG